MNTVLEVRPPVELAVGAKVEMPETLLSELVLGTGLKALLQASGLVCFDGGAVAYREKAWLVIGRASSGKSTLLARLCQLGGRFIADDLAAVHGEGPGTYVVRRGAMRSKLWPDALSALDHGPSSGVPVAPWLGKRVLAINELDSCPAAEIGAVVVCRIDRVSSPVIERVDFRRSIPLLLAASARLEEMTPEAHRASRVALLMGMAAELPVFCLTTNPISCDVGSLLRCFEGRLEEISESA